MSEVVKYKVWVQIEGLDEDGECMEGDSYFEPCEIGVYPTESLAHDVVCEVQAYADKIFKSME